MNTTFKTLGTLTLFCITSIQIHAGIVNLARPHLTKTYTEHIVHFADEYKINNTANRLITLNYRTMKLLGTRYVSGGLNHHADPLGSLEKANYLMMVPKASNYVTIRSITTGNFVKKIRLPFQPRSGDAYNKTHHLVLLTAKNRPAAVLIDTKKVKIVGKAGFNINCKILDISHIYQNEENFNNDFNCPVPEVGGNQISGHPLWLNATHFIIIDRSNRLLHVYRIKHATTELWDTELVQTIKTDSSMHQIIPEYKNNANNTIFYGMTEGGIRSDHMNNNTIPKVYKYEFDGEQLHEIASTKVIIKNEDASDPIQIIGTQGHNLYITPNKQYLYAPMGGRVQQNNWTSKHMKNGAIFVISTADMKVEKQIAAGKGAGHVAFSQSKEMAIVTNHQDNFVTIIDYNTHSFIKNVFLDFKNEHIFNLTQSHMQHVSEDGKYYYNFWTQGGVFFRINLSTLSVDKSVYTGGIPIQGNFYKTVAPLQYTLPIEDGFNDIFQKKEDLLPKDMPRYKEKNTEMHASESNGYDT